MQSIYGPFQELYAIPEHTPNMVYFASNQLFILANQEALLPSLIKSTSHRIHHKQLSFPRVEKHVFNCVTIPLELYINPSNLQTFSIEVVRTLANANLASLTCLAITQLQLKGVNQVVAHLPPTDSLDM